MSSLISVIMPVYNREESVQFAIESVLAQTYKNFELILIDDASTDKTLDVLNFYKEKDSRVRVVVNKENSRNADTQWETRNDGIKIAKGDFFAYLDSDNLWHKDFLFKMVSAFTDDKIKLAYCFSRNHYKNETQFKSVFEKDNREIIDKDEKAFYIAFKSREFNVGTPGIDWYIDTNEIMHRAEVFNDLKEMWRTFHPNREVINASQIIRAPYRRHNDQDLVERILNYYGESSVIKVPEVLTEYFYSDNQKKYQKIIVGNNIVL